MFSRDGVFVACSSVVVVALSLGVEGDGRGVCGGELGGCDCEETITFPDVSYGFLLKACFPKESWAVRARHFFSWDAKLFLLTKSSLHFLHCSFCLRAVSCLSGVCVIKSANCHFLLVRCEDRSWNSPLSCPLAILSCVVVVGEVGVADYIVQATVMSLIRAHW